MKAKMWPKLATYLICLSFTAITSNMTLATSAMVPSADELALGDRAIVLGHVTNGASSYDDAQRGIFTYITLQVSQVYKGNLALGSLVIKEPGGVIRDRGSLIFGIPTFSVGEQVLLYLDTWPDGSLRVYQWF